MLEFFDCNCMIGRKKVSFSNTMYKKEDILKRMDSVGIGKALVTSTLSIEYNPMYGNERIIEETWGQDRLLPVWTVLPNQCREFINEEDIPLLMKQNGVKTVRIVPAEDGFNHSLNELVCGKLFSTLEQHSIPVMMNYDISMYNEIVNMLGNHPKLRIIFLNTGYRINRHFYPLLDKYEHVYIETSGFKQYRGIEGIIGTFGPNKLVFGSGMPTFSAGAAVTMITHSNISEEYKHMIAHRNLENLLEGVQI